MEMNGESVAVDKPARTRKKKSAGEERKTCGLNPEVILKLNPLCKKIEDEWNKIDRREIFVGPIDFSLKRYFICINMHGEKKLTYN